MKQGSHCLSLQPFAIEEDCNSPFKKSFSSVAFSLRELFLQTKEVLKEGSPYQGFMHLGFCLFHTSLILCGKYGSPYLAKANAATRAMLPTPYGVCSIFVCLSNGVAASVVDL